MKLISRVSVLSIDVFDDNQTFLFFVFLFYFIFFSYKLYPRLGYAFILRFVVRHFESQRTKENGNRKLSVASNQMNGNLNFLHIYILAELLCKVSTFRWYSVFPICVCTVHHTYMSLSMKEKKAHTHAHRKEKLKTNASSYGSI